MKIKNLLILGLVLLGFTYCSSDDVLDGPATGNEKVDNLKMEIVIKTPTVRSSTNDGGGSDATTPTESGTINESKINSVLVAIYDASDVTKMYFSETKDPATNGTFETVEFKIPNLSVGNQYYVYVFANPYEGLQTDLGIEGIKANLDAKFDKDGGMASLDAAITALTKKASTQDNFFMSNATKVLSEPLKITHTTGEAALKVNVDVQRAVARMDYVANKSITDNKYTIKETDVVVEFTDYKLINTSKSFYSLKRVSANGDGADAVIGDPESPINYVVDTDWPDKASTGFFNYMGAATTTPLAFTKLEDRSYVTENTSPEGKDALKGHATAVVFKGKLGVENEVEGVNKPVYVWSNKVYKSYDELPGAIKTAVGGEENLADLAANGVTRYTYEAEYGYPVYYVYYNKHNDNKKPTETGAMEFAVVRNNVYKLTINSLSRFGHPNDPELDPGTEGLNPDPNPENPEDPIESADLYMQVTATVLPWTVRENSIDF